MNRAADAHKISKSGLAAFYAAVDPFHDKPIDDLIGWPDLETAPSVVRKWKDTYTVKAIESGGSILITHDPIARDAAFYEVAMLDNVILSQNQGISQAAEHSTVTVYAMNAATSNTGAFLLEGTQVFSSDISQYIGDGPGRLLGLGIEVHDVTAELYKQGTITCFEVPETREGLEVFPVATMVIDGVQTGTGVLGARKLARAPSNYSTAMSLPTTVQWDAKDGAYVVIPFSAVDNVPCLETSVAPAFVDNSDAELMKVPIFIAGAPNEPAGHGSNLILSTRQRGIYLSGLNENSTFTITIQYYWETFPKTSSNIRTLASPSAPFDPKALALISLVSKELPVATPVGNNASGDWFWEIVQDVLPLVGGVASAMFPEFSPLIVPAAAAGATFAQNRLAKSKAKKQEKQEARDREQARSAKRQGLITPDAHNKMMRK